MNSTQYTRLNTLVTVLEEDVKDKEYVQQLFWDRVQGAGCALGHMARNYERFPGVVPHSEELPDFGPDGELILGAMNYFGLDEAEACVAFGGEFRTRTQEIALLRNIIARHEDTDPELRSTRALLLTAGTRADDVVSVRPTIRSRIAHAIGCGLDYLSREPVATLDRGFDL